jgi:hypothetical protein
VLSGGITAFMLSTTKAAGLPGGYAIAICNFQNAVGYAETVDNAGLGDWGVMSSYLAYVIANPYFRPRSIEAEIGEFAITPFPDGYCTLTSCTDPPKSLATPNQQLRLRK